MRSNYKSLAINFRPFDQSVFNLKIKTFDWILGHFRHINWIRFGHQSKLWIKQRQKWRGKNQFRRFIRFTWANSLRSKFEREQLFWLFGFNLFCHSKKLYSESSRDICICLSKNCFRSQTAVIDFDDIFGILANNTERAGLCLCQLFPYNLDNAQTVAKILQSILARSTYRETPSGPFERVIFIFEFECICIEFRIPFSCVHVVVFIGRN